MVKQLVYRSRAVIHVTPEVVGDILVTARRNNMRRALTGLLLYGEGIFMQVLEGAPDDVDEIYGKIRRDLRHVDMQDIYVGYADERAYPDWQMACRPLQTTSMPDDIFNLATDILDQHSESKAIDVGQFMKSFYRGIFPMGVPDPSDMN